MVSTEATVDRPQTHTRKKRPYWGLLVLVTVFAYFATRLGALLHTGVGEGLLSILFGARFLGFYWPWMPVSTVPSGVPRAFIEVMAQPSTASQLFFSFGGVLTTTIAGVVAWLILRRKEHGFTAGLFLWVLATVLLLDLPTALLTRAGHLRFVAASLPLPAWVLTLFALALTAALVWPLSKSWLLHLSEAIPVRTRGNRFVAYLLTVFIPFFLLPQIANLIFRRFEEPFFRTAGVWACLLLVFATFLLLPNRLFQPRTKPGKEVRPSVPAIWAVGLVAAAVLGSQVFGTGADYFRMKGLFWGRYRVEQPGFGNLSITLEKDGTAQVVARLRPSLPSEAWWQKLYRKADPASWQPYLQAFEWNVSRLLGLKSAALRAASVRTRNDPEAPFFLLERATMGARRVRAAVDVRPLLRRDGDGIWLSVRFAARREINWEEVRVRAGEGLEIDNYEAMVPPLRVPRGTMVGETIGYLGLPDEPRAQPSESTARDLVWRRTRTSEIPSTIRIRFRSPGGESAMPLQP